MAILRIKILVILLPSILVNTKQMAMLLLADLRAIEAANMKLMMTSKVALNLSGKRLFAMEIKRKYKDRKYFVIFECTELRAAFFTSSVFFFTRVKVGKKFAIVERSILYPYKDKGSIKNKKVDKSTCFNSTIVEINIKHHMKKPLDLYLCWRSSWRVRLN